MGWLKRGGEPGGVSGRFCSGCGSRGGDGVGNIGCFGDRRTGLDGVELISMGERLRCRDYEISVRENKAIRWMKFTSVVLGPASTGGAAGGMGESGWGVSKVSTCGVVIGCSGDEASDMGSGSGVVPMLT